MRYISVLFLFLLLFSCSHQENEDSPVVASVGKNILTISDIENIFYSETGLEISGMQIYRYVQRWIESELIYQEAIGQGLKEEPAVRKHLRDLERDYLVNLFLERNNNLEIAITDQDIQNYYDKNRTEFVRPENFYKVRILLAENYRSASTLRKEISAGGDFATIARTHSLDGSKENGGELGWKAPSELDQAIAQRIATLGQNALSTPIKSDAGYYLIQVTDIRKKGDTMTLEEVRETIVSRLKLEKQKENFKDLLSNLSEKYEMSSNLELLKRFENQSH